jgi:hypothetical protein
MKPLGLLLALGLLTSAALFAQEVKPKVYTLVLDGAV